MLVPSCQTFMSACADWHGGWQDEISTGLDSSTTYQIVKYLGDLTHTQMNTSLISLLQPAPESYDLFDDVLLIAEGAPPVRLARHPQKPFRMHSTELYSCHVC
jgi:hypothetical protein